jgi:hypothetical protein
MGKELVFERLIEDHFTLSQPPCPAFDYFILSFFKHGSPEKQITTA